MFKMMYHFFNSLAEAASMTDETRQAAAASQLISSVGMLVVVMVVFYFTLIRPQNKKDKEKKAMHDSIQIGDEVVTIGGITGIVLRINRNSQDSAKDTVVIETGGERNKIRVMVWAISENLTQHDTEEELGKKKNQA